MLTITLAVILTLFSLIKGSFNEKDGYVRLEPLESQGALQFTDSIPPSTGVAKSVIECIGLVRRKLDNIDSLAIKFNRDSKTCRVGVLPPELVTDAPVGYKDPSGDRTYMIARNVLTVPEPVEPVPDPFPSGLLFYMPLVSNVSEWELHIFWGDDQIPIIPDPARALASEGNMFGSLHAYYYTLVKKVSYNFVTPYSSTFLSSFSVFTWIWIPSGSAANRYAVVYGRASTTKAGIQLLAGTEEKEGKIVLRMFDPLVSLSVPIEVSSDSSVINYEEWTHIGASYNSITGQVQLFHNGQSVHDSIILTDYRSTQLYQVILSFLSTWRCTGCQQAHVEVYEQALDLTQAQNIYQRA